VLIHRYGRDSSLSARVKMLEEDLAAIRPWICYARVLPWLSTIVDACEATRTPVVAGLASDLDVRLLSPLSCAARGHPRRARNWAWHNRGARALARCSAIVAQTWDQERAVKEILRYDVPCRVIPSMFPMPAETSPVVRDTPYLLWAANLKLVKRPELFIEVVRRAASAGISGVMMGAPQDRRCAATVRAALRELPVLEWLGGIPLEESWPWFAGALAGVNTSAVEGFPNAFIQSWLVGTPVISMGVDPDGIVSSQHLGLVVEGIDEAAEAASGFLQDRVLRAEYGARAQAYALVVHDPARVVRQHRALMEYVVNLHGRGG
jgi:glycosyltransferase involved in cell wall biosynthesis